MKGDKSCMNIFDDWFYILLVILVGFIILAVNLGFLGSQIFAYWPILLIVIALKEILDRR